MTAIGNGPDMDVYAEPIAEHAAHPASARLFREAQGKRPGRTDIFTGEFIPLTEEEIEQARQDRLDRRITIASMGFFALVMITGAVAYWLGWLAGTGQLS